MSKPKIPEGITLESILKRKSSSSRSFQVPLRKWFPPDDDFATCIARLCILREDLSLEVRGIVAGPCTELDANGIRWRHNYFFRNSVKTLREISSALHMLNDNSEFQRVLRKRWSEKEQEHFQDFCKKVRDASELLGEVRNSIGGHVKHTVVARALKILDFDWTGFWERPFDLRDKPLHTHHPFANDLVFAALVAGDPKDDLPQKDIEEVLNIPRVTAELTDAVAHIDSLFELYVVERQLL